MITGFSEFTNFAKLSPIGYCSLEKNSNGMSSGVLVGFPSESTTVTKISKVLSISAGINLGKTEICNPAGKVDES